MYKRPKAANMYYLLLKVGASTAASCRTKNIQHQRKVVLIMGLLWMKGILIPPPTI